MSDTPDPQPISRKVLAVVGSIYREDPCEPDVFGTARFMDGIEMALAHPEWANTLLGACSLEGMPGSDYDWPSLIPVGGEA